MNNNILLSVVFFKEAGLHLPYYARLNGGLGGPSYAQRTN